MPTGEFQDECAKSGFQLQSKATNDIIHRNSNDPPRTALDYSVWAQPRPGKCRLSYRL
jgi:hypothetical protein